MSFLEDVRTPELDSTFGLPSVPQLANYVSQLDDSPALNLGPDGHYAVPLSKWVTNPKGVRAWNMPTGNAKRRLGIPETGTLLLAGQASDRLLHGFWCHRTVCGDPWQAIGEAGFDIVLGPDFSVWSNAPRIEYMIEMKRSLVAAAEIQQCGIPVAPNVLLHSGRDVERWADWIKANDTVTAIATNVQFLTKRKRSGKAMRNINEIAEIFRELRGKLNREIQLVAIGVLQPSHVRLLGKTGFSVTVVNGKAFQAACHWRRLVVQDASITEIEDKGATKQDLYEANEKLLAQVYDEILE